MAQLGVTFDAAKVQPYEAGLPVWEGRVPEVIMRSEIKATAANDGNSMLLLHVKALDAPYAGQEQVIRLNLYNKNAQAVDIAQRQLSSICHVTGVMQCTDADQLIGKPFIGVWSKESRELTDQTTNAKRMIEGCQCKDWQFIDGRTIKEAMGGQAATSPYIPGQTGLQEVASRGQGGGAPAPQPQHNPAPAPQPGFGGGGAPQGGFQAPTPQPGGAPSAGFASPALAPGQGGTPPAPQGGFGTAASGFNPPAAGGGAPAGGFAPPQAQGGFTPPQPGQAGAGPWSGAPTGGAPTGFGPR